MGTTMEEQIEKAFKHHKPYPMQKELHESIRNSAKELALKINNSMPDSREKSLAITKLEEAVMWANAGIARNK